MRITGTSARRHSFEFSPAIWPAIKNCLILQVVLGLLTSLMLDGGGSFKFFQVAFIGHWIAIIMILGRRPLSQTGLDLVLIRFGILIFMIITGLIAPVVWDCVGHSQFSGIERIKGA